MKIALLLPTRKRPQRLKQLFESVVATADNINNIEVCLYVDNDDNDTISKLEELSKILTLKWKIGERIILSQMWNEAFKIVSRECEIFHQSNDDLIFITKSWDSKVIEAFNQYKDKIVLVGGNDGSGTHHGKFFTAGFIHRNWINTLGYAINPYFVSDYGDTWNDELAKNIGRWHYIPDLLIQHFHPAWNTREYDETDKDRIARHYKEDVRKLYVDLEPKRKEDEKKLKKFIEDFLRLETLKELAKQAQELKMGY